MSDDHVLLQITEVVQSLNGTVLHYNGAVSAETSIINDLKLDSLAVMDFVMAVETKFDTIIPIESMVTVATLGDLAALLRAQAVQPVA